MTVKCVVDNLERLPPDSAIRKSGRSYFGTDTAMPFKAGDVFVVYVLVHSPVGDWFYVDFVGSRKAPYPSPVHRDFFVVLDPAPSRFWETWTTDSEIGGAGTVSAFPEWRQEGFYQRLLNEEEPEQSAFIRRKNEMDHEFPNPWKFLTATDFGFPWVQCPDCDEAWQTDRIAGVVDCPKCGKPWNNPFYAKTKVSK